MKTSQLKKNKLFVVGFILIVFSFIIISQIIFPIIRFVNAYHYWFHISASPVFSVQADANFIQKILDGEIANQTQGYSLPFDSLNKAEVEKLIEYMSVHDLKITGTAGYKTSQKYLTEYARCNDMIKLFKFAPCEESS